MSPAGPWVVYLIRCRGGRLYCGITNDFAARWASHQAGKGARFTRAFPPEAVEMVVPVAGRSAALSLEARVKRLPKEKKREALVLAALTCGQGIPGVSAAAGDQGLAPLYSRDVTK